MRGFELSREDLESGWDAEREILEEQARKSSPRPGWQANCAACVASKFTCDEHFRQFVSNRTGS